MYSAITKDVVYYPWIPEGTEPLPRQQLQGTRTSSTAKNWDPNHHLA